MSPRRSQIVSSGPAAQGAVGDLTQWTVSILTRMINMGELGDPMPPERQIADLLGVSRVTIRRAMSVLESQKIVRRLHGQGTFAQQGPPLSTIEELEREAGRSLVVLVEQDGPRLNIQRTPFTWRICEALRDSLGERGLALRFMRSDQFLSAAIDGRVPVSRIHGAFAPSHLWSQEQYEMAMACNVPWVGLGRTSLAMYWNIIDLDWAGAVREAIDVLAPTAKDRVFIPNEPYPREIDEQYWLEAALDRLAHHGVKAGQIVIHSAGPYESNGYLATRWYMREFGLPTVVLSNFDLSAVGVYRAIRAFHDRAEDPIVAGHTRVVGAADLSISQYLSPALSTLRIDFDRVAMTVLDMLDTQRRSGTASRLERVSAQFVRRG